MGRKRDKPLGRVQIPMYGTLDAGPRLPGALRSPVLTADDSRAAVPADRAVHPARGTRPKRSRPGPAGQTDRSPTDCVGHLVGIAAVNRSMTPLLPRPVPATAVPISSWARGPAEGNDGEQAGERGRAGMRPSLS